MRETPTWRIPVGIIGLFLGLIVYGVLIAVYLADTLATWHWLAQTLVYVILGVVWLLPLGNFLIWMETGHWGRPPSDPSAQDNGTNNSNNG